MEQSPWYKMSLEWKYGERTLRYGVPHDVFSTQRIDEGTQLLLDYLPSTRPSRVLDVGCGYGALGLPVAALYPNAHLELIDRDLLAVEWAALNASANGLNRVKAYGSLGYQKVEGLFDWILCNVPARIGRPFLKYLVEVGMQHLSPDGELRMVVINDLGPELELLSKDGNWPMILSASGARHKVYSVKLSAFDFSTLAPIDEASLYFRDQIEWKGLSVARPFDLGGDDPQRLNKGLPVLYDVLPRNASQPPDRVLCFRNGYGLLPRVVQDRWPSAKIVTVDRDLLGLDYIHRNNNHLEVRESSSLPKALLPHETFDLILGELSPSAGIRVAQEELLTISKHLSTQGRAFVLGLTKIEKEGVDSYSKKMGIRLTAVLRRDGYTAFVVNSS